MTSLAPAGATQLRRRRAEQGKQGHCAGLAATQVLCTTGIGIFFKLVRVGEVLKKIPPPSHPPFCFALFHFVLGQCFSCSLTLASLFSQLLSSHATLQSRLRDSRVKTRKAVVIRSVLHCPLQCPHPDPLLLLSPHTLGKPCLPFPAPPSTHLDPWHPSPFYGL